MELLKRYSKLDQFQKLMDYLRKQGILTESGEIRVSSERPQPSSLPHVQRVDRRLSAETIAELVQAYQDGVGTPTLRKRYGISQGSVLNLLRQHGVIMRRNGRNQHSRHDGEVDQT